MIGRVLCALGKCSFVDEKSILVTRFGNTLLIRLESKCKYCGKGHSSLVEVPLSQILDGGGNEFFLGNVLPAAGISKHIGDNGGGHEYNK